MLSTHPFHIGYADSANRSSHNAASTAWVIVSPSDEFLDFGVIFLGHDTNNIDEDEVVIALLTNASALGIHSLVVQLDSELIIS